MPKSSTSATTPKPKPENDSPARTPRKRVVAPAPPAEPSLPAIDWRKMAAELTDNLNKDIFGLIFLFLGVLLLIVCWLGNPAWLERMLGWTAQLFALTIMLCGLVLMFETRFGYWSAEALVGAELLLLALQSGTFAVNNSAPIWPVLGDGRNGGMVGWSLGSLMVAGLGQWPALFFIALIGGAGLLLLMRYTPLIYLSVQLGRAFPLLRDLILRLSATVSNLFPEDPVDEMEPLAMPAPPHAENFVSARPSRPLSEIDHAAEQAWNDVAPLRSARVERKAGSLFTARKPTQDELAESAPKNEPKPIAKNPEPTTKVEPSRDEAAKVNQSAAAAKVSPPQKPAPLPKPLRTADQLPAIDLLQPDSETHSAADVRQLQTLIENTLEDFNVPVRVVHVESGPTVTQFGVEPLYTERAGQRRKVRVSRIVNLADDLALALAAPAVRIEAPVPGRPYVGIEVPNPEKTMVGLRGIMESAPMRKDGGMLGLPLGRNTAGAPIAMDLVRAPHMLIAGSTGSGKSVCINTIITGLLMQHGPETLRFVMVDPKMVELVGYNGIPHLLGKVITEVDQVMGALTWMLLQMDDRYRTFREVGVRNILAYHEKVRKQKKSDPTKLEPLPYIVLIIDELADLMMTAAEDIERQICRLAQMARATGIHLILATQRPSVDVVTGLIKANFPSRIAFAVTSQTDSRVILDTPGAERLLGRGDMLLMRSDSPNLQRIQGCYVHDDEIQKIVSFWKAQQGSDESAHPAPWQGLLDQLDDEDELIQDAIDILRGAKTASTSLLQRKLQLGYPKASKLMEQLAERGIVGPDLGGGRGREVLLKDEESDDGADTDGQDDADANRHAI
ncbi:MAG: DNA translocase FtsK [Caldilineaceae bacterium]